jgi:hypothetical protein
MRAKYVCIVAFVALLLFNNIGVRGQEQPKDLSIQELKEQIVKLQSIEANEALSADVRNINRRFLEQRRTQLRALMQKTISELRSYRATAGSILTADEIKILDAEIAQNLKELESESLGSSSGPPPVQTESASASSIVASSSAQGTNTAAEPRRSESALLNVPATPTRSSSSQPSFPGPLMPGPIGPQDLTLTGSDPNSSDLIKDDVHRELSKVVQEITKARAEPGTTLIQARKAAFDITANPKLYAELLSLILTNEMLPRDEFIRDIEAARIDKQVGGPSGNAGSTSLVSKGGTPAIIGFAVENGGLTRTIDGTTVTLRGNPIGLVEALQRKGFVTSYQDDSASAKFLRKLSFSASFDTSRGDTPGTFLANRQQLSGYSFRYEFKNDRDPRNPKYKAQWEALVRNHAQQVANDLSWIQRLFDTHPAYSTWLTAAKEAVANASPGDLANVVAVQFQALQDIPIPSELAAKLESFRTDFNAYRGERSKLLEIVANGPIFTFEYVNSRRPGLVDTSNLKFVAETGLFKGKGDLTYNGSFTLFNSNPGPGMKRLRDFDNSLRLDVPLGDVRKVGNFVLTFAGQYKRLTESDMPGLNNKGDIASGQLLFTVPIKGTGLKIPLSVSFANRTELVKEKEIRGNFGFTFDLDAIFARFKPF